MDAALADQITKSLSHDIQDYDLQKIPLLAHYTTMDSLEKIMASDELWFSHPLLMNDHEEIHWGINQCVAAIQQSPMLRITLKDDYGAFIGALQAAIERYGKNHLFDTYVFCLSEHDKDDNDGRLSMWRGYGGDGKGAAIVFDPSKLIPREDGALVLDQVVYKSSSERAAWALNLVALIEDNIQAHGLGAADLADLAAIVFHRVKLAAIFSKHRGFEEEREWRAVFMPERDGQGHWKQFCSYANGKHGLEPKLKFKVAPLAGVSEPDLSLEKIVDRIILGPHRASYLVEGSAERMLINHGKLRLAQTLKASGIPYRSFG
jgi:hypothetical protein